MASKGQKFKKHNFDVKEVILDRYLNGESSVSLGKEDTFFVACLDKQYVSGMEYPYDGLLIDENKKGILMFYLKGSALSGLISLSSPSKMTLENENHIFIPAEDIKEIIIKKFALLNNKIKRIQINTVDGKSHKLYANVDEKDLPYHKDNFAKFMNKYGAK